MLGEHVLSATFEGYNSCVFAYGQSGTGKTYTMFGNEETSGLIQHVNEEIFNKAASSDTDTSYRAEIRYLSLGFFFGTSYDIISPQPLGEKKVTWSIGKIIGSAEQSRVCQVCGTTDIFFGLKDYMHH